MQVKIKRDQKLNFKLILYLIETYWNLNETSRKKRAGTVWTWALWHLLVVSTFCSYKCKTTFMLSPPKYANSVQSFNQGENENESHSRTNGYQIRIQGAKYELVFLFSYFFEKYRTSYRNFCVPMTKIPLVLSVLKIQLQLWFLRHVVSVNK